MKQSIKLPSLVSFDTNPNVYIFSHFMDFKDKLFTFWRSRWKVILMMIKAQATSQTIENMKLECIDRSNISGINHMSVVSVSQS